MINVTSRLLPVIPLATTRLNFSLGLILTALVRDLVVQNQKPHMLKLLEQSLKRRQIRNYEFKTIKHYSNFATSLLYIPGFLFDVPDLLALPKLCKKKTYCFTIF